MIQDRIGMFEVNEGLLSDCTHRTFDFQRGTGKAYFVAAEVQRLFYHFVQHAEVQLVLAVGFRVKTEEIGIQFLAIADGGEKAQQTLFFKTSGEAKIGAQLLFQLCEVIFTNPQHIEIGLIDYRNVQSIEIF